LTRELTLQEIGEEICAAAKELTWAQRKDVVATLLEDLRKPVGKTVEEQMKNAFEASGNSPTRGGLESIKRHIEEAFNKIRQHPVEPPTPTQAEFVYTEVHRAKFDERAKRLTLAALSCPHIPKVSRRDGVWDINIPTQTAEELIAAALGE
jgi:hypothetical protein